MSREITRRDFVTESVLASAGAMVAPACCGLTTQPAEGRQSACREAANLDRQDRQARTEPSDARRQSLERLCHSRDLRYVSQLMCHYNTDEKILETLALAEKPASTRSTCTSNRTPPTRS